MKSLIMSIFILLRVGLVVQSDEKDTWIQKANVPTARFAHTSCVVNGKIYTIGRVKARTEAPFGKLLSTVEEYTPEGWQSIVSPQGNSKNMG